MAPWLECLSYISKKQNKCQLVFVLWIDCMSTYSSGRLSSDGFDKRAESVFGHRFGGETHLLQGVGAVAESDGVRSQWMPVIKVGKFHVDSVGELECRLVAKQLGIVGQFHFVLAQVLDVLLDGNFQILGQHDQFGRLVQSFIVPSRMLCPKDVADAVVLPQPDGGHDEQTRLHAEQRVSESHLHNRLILHSKFKIHLNRFL